jgi:hypothetical protein
MIALLFLAFTATFHPPKPAVGDLITIQFAQPATLDPSPDYEVMGPSPGPSLRSGPPSPRGAGRGDSRVIVIRTFMPRPIALSGVSGGVRFRNLVVPVRSVLAPKDAMQPAPLVPPRVPPQPRTAMIAILIASVLAVAGWVTAYLLSREKKVEPAVYVAPAERFRIAVKQSARSKQRWASLANAVRAYLAARGYGPDLTSSQLLGQLHDEVVEEILRLGDLEKFSPWGAPAGDFDGAAQRALTLLERFEPRELSEEAAA